ncbi:helix-turn-helix transcriptional regulator [Planomonospora sp. ID91781]|uniref:helix-turn-helix domain-containing protein n=1 Tax=Planomonospora sp. ID91781 TaxID=2738135 RepID=UPI0018C3B508|nr:helix-turn-helix domain-containing protein [Planomonospora sp. ID91781]MBG0820427.1 helix-turn-helix transcriptional regulator [Planomonospora sp. ID91781]
MSRDSFSKGVGVRADAQRNRERILDAAEEVFAHRGTSASTEEVARLAGVAIGTVFRHFPTKDDLLAEILKRLLARLAEDAATLGGAGGLHVFFRRLVEQAAAKRTVVDLAGVSVPGAVGQLGEAVGELLRQAQAAGTVRGDVGRPEVMALLVSVCQGALQGGWDLELQERTLAVIFAGLAA